MDKNEQDDLEKAGNSYARFTGLGFQMAGIIGVLSYAGYKIDAHAGHQTKWVTAILALAGVFISLYLIIKAVKQ